MNKKRILMSTGAILLAAFGFVAGKAHSRLTAVDVYYKLGGTTCTQFGSSTNWTTTGSGTNTSIRNTAGSAVTVYTDDQCTSTASTIRLK